MGTEDDTVAPYERLERFGKASWWALGIVLLIALAFYLLQRFGSFILPSLVGIVLATTLSPIVGWMERRRVPRLLGAVIVSLLMILVLVALAWAAIVIVVDQSAQIWRTLTEASSQHRPLARRLGDDGRHAGQAAEGHGRDCRSGRGRRSAAAGAAGRPPAVRPRRRGLPRRRVQLLLPLGGPAGEALDLRAPDAAHERSACASPAASCAPPGATSPASRRSAPWRPSSSARRPASPGRPPGRSSP